MTALTLWTCSGDPNELVHSKQLMNGHGAYTWCVFPLPHMVWEVKGQDGDIIGSSRALTGLHLAEKAGHNNEVLCLWLLPSSLPSQRVPTAFWRLPEGKIASVYLPSGERAFLNCASVGLDVPSLGMFFSETRILWFSLVFTSKLLCTVLSLSCFFT